MSQHDFDIANQGFPATRADLNNALQALASASSGATAPSTTYANQLWYDTANNILKFRNEDNDAWIDLLYLDQTNDAVARLDVDNIRIDGNTISSTDTNGDITVSPDGTAQLEVTPGGSSEGKIAIRDGKGDAVTSGTTSSSLLFTARDSSIRTLAQIDAVHTTTNGTAGDLKISTRGGDTLSERIRINSSGTVLINKTSTDFNTAGIRMDSELNVIRANATPVFINRTGNDGGLIQFYQAGVEEGSISVSGTTVSYNGGHLARWSQLADNTEDTSIVKGTVMTNLDQMAVWHHEAQPATYYEEGDELPEGVSVGDEKTPAVAAYDEDNEQLNCMAVSSVEGDPNVAGVFVNWDDDDEDYTADMNVAMTGDMVIRIAQGTTVARGDLLMSAGDGTAKPQGDDIVRSKTIAKVTSTTVSHTYDDGSYLVPCVLMAC